MKKNHIFTTLIAFILFLCLSYFVYVFNQKSLTLVIISINPDIQLAVNDNGIVEEVLSINDEADIITSDLNLVGKNIDIATEKIIDASIETGFIDEYSSLNSIIITTINEDDRIQEETEQQVITKVKNHLKEKRIDLIVATNGINNKIKQNAKELDINNGKMLLINRAIIINPELSAEELADMSFKEIQAVIKEYIEKRYEGANQSLKELREIWKEEKASLKESRKRALEDLKESLLEESLDDVENMTKEEQKQIIEEKLKERKEMIKENVNQVKQVIGNSLKEALSPEEIKDNISNTIRDLREKVIKNR